MRDSLAKTAFSPGGETGGFRPERPPVGDTVALRAARPPGARTRSATVAATLLTLCFWIAAPPPAPASQEPAAPQPASTSTTTDAAKVPPPAAAYAGDAACQACHQKEAATYSETAHHLTSRLPTAAAIEGSFTRPTNLMLTANPNIAF